MNAHSVLGHFSEAYGKMQLENRKQCNRRFRARITLRLGTCAALLLLLLGLARPAAAQLDTGSISGVVTDPAGNVVRGATITARETSTGTAYSTVSSSAGYYVFPSVRTGTYEVRVSAGGFKTEVFNGVVVSIGAHTARDASLAVGATSESVEVAAAGVSLEKESSDIDATITPTQVSELPLQVSGTLRMLSVLEFLVPGAVGPGTSSGGAGGQLMDKINGGQDEGSDFLVDGLTTNRQENGSGGFEIVAPSIDAIQEFHITLSGLPADLGRTTGGLANYNTKSGTNSYHGLVYDFYKNAALDGNNWFNNGYIAQQGNTAAAQAQYKRPIDTKNDYGLTMGGPIRVPHFYNGKDKSFFFFSWEQLRYSTGSDIPSIIPIPAEIGSNGQYLDFSSTLGGQIFNADGTPATDACNSKLYFGEIFDPQTEANGCRTPMTYNGNLNEIPISRESNVAKAVLKYMPSPNLTNGTDNFVYDSSDTLNQTVYSFRVDQNLGASHKIWAFFDSRENTDQGGSLALPVPLNTCCAASNQLGKLFRAGWDWILTPTLINSLTVGSNRSWNNTISRAGERGIDWDTQLGIANGSGPVFPGFEFIGSPFSSFGENSGAIDVDNTIALNDTVHWQHGAHSFKFGGEGQYHQYSFVSRIGGTCSGTSGCFTFYDNQTASDTTYWGLDGNSFAAFLVGESATANDIQQLHAPRWIMHTAAAFAQDDWKVRSNLTLNLGFRWSYDTPRHEADGATTIMSPLAMNSAANNIPGALVFAGKGAGRNGNVDETWASTYYKDLEPRVGFAWAPNFYDQRIVIRGSSGIYYGPLVYADYGQGTVQGFVANQTLFTADPLDGPIVDNGLPLEPTTPDLDPTQLNGQGVDYVAPGYGRPAKVLTWTLENQLQITPNLFFSLGYLGMHSTRLHGLIDYPNDMPLSGTALGNGLFEPVISNNVGVTAPYANFYNTWGTGVTVEQALRPFPQYGYINTDSYLQNVGQSTYNALEAKLERRFHNGFNLLASYTFSKTLTDADAIQPYYSTLQSQGGTQNPYDHKAEKAVSNQDVPNNFVVSYLYELPVGRGKQFLNKAPAPVNAVIGGWRISGIQRYLSGQPISFFGATGIPGFDNGIRPNRVTGQKVKGFTGKYNPFGFVNTNNFGPGSGSCSTGYWNCTAFSDPNSGTNRGTGPWTFGDMPRNSADIRSFAYYDEDFGINKTIPIRESVHAEFRGELFNAFNRHVFNKPDSGIQDDSFGQVGSTLNGPRNVQFTLRITY